MGVLGARPGDITNCLFGGNRDACQRVYFGYYLWPRLQRLLEQLEMLPAPVPPWPEPDPSQLLEELVPMLLAPYLGDPDPQPNIPVDVRREITVKFRESLQALVKELDEGIVRLEQHAQAKS
jgi:hypothetical protein